jgi:diacylglycerol kinase (ATP)
MSGNWVAIVNPTSGTAGLDRRLLSTLLRRLAELADPVVTTRYQGHAGCVAASFGNADGFIVAGGDGTVFEVLQVLRRDSQQALVVPMGRGNSLARDLGAAAPSVALRSLASGRSIRIDLLAVSLEFDDGRRWQGVCASNLAVGYPAEVVRLAGARLRWAGRHGYALASAATRPSMMVLHVSYDGGPSAATAVTGIIISNTRHIGPFEGFPEANLADGLCDVAELRAGWCGQSLHNLSVLSGWHGYAPAAFRRAKTVVVAPDHPTVVKIDGELRTGVTRVMVSVHPAALTCRVPGPAHG